MSTTTTRNSLVKPDYTDAADIAVINTTLDTIDAAIAKCNYAGTAAPTANDDSGDGYSIGSVWMDRTNNNIYVAKTVTVGAAVWTLQAMHNNFSATGAPTVNDDIDLHYAPGSLWVDITNHNVYVCEVNTNGAAVWKQVNTAAISGYVKQDGSLPLTADWDVGAYHITADYFVSDVADGTAPYQTTSKTVCTNLNADMLDGLHDTSFVKQTLADAKGDLIVASGADAWARQAVSATDGEVLVADASATNGVSWQPQFSGHQHNLLANPSFRITQHGVGTVTSTTTPNNNDDTYVTDQWTLLSDGNDVMDVWPTSATWTSGADGAILLQTETANKKAGIIQFLEYSDTRPVAGLYVSLRFSAYTNSTYPNSNVMAAVLSWDGTADTLTSDVVSSWEAAGTAPKLVTNWTYENTPTQLALVNDVWTEYKIEEILIDTSGVNNIAVFLWLDDTNSSVDDRVYFSKVQLNVGRTCLPYSSPSSAEQLARCQRYYYVAGAEGVAYQHFAVGVAYSSQYIYTNHLPPAGLFFQTAATTTGSAADTIGATPNGANIDVISGENKRSNMVWKFDDTGKAFTENKAYILLGDATGNARIYTSSRL